MICYHLKSRDVIVKYGQKMAAGEVPGLTRSSPLKRAKTFNDLASLCSVYSEVELFLWLQNKFPPINLMEQQTALAKRDLTSDLISQALADAEKLRLDHCHIDRDKKMRKTWEEEQQRMEEEEDSEEEEEEDGLDEYDRDAEGYEGDATATGYRKYF